MIIKTAIIFSLLLLAGIVPSAIQASEVMTEITTKIPASKPGSIRRFKARCEQLKDNFTIDVWMPDSYSPDGDDRYPVIYMHDGQNLFDPSISFNGTAWEIDLALEKLSTLGIIHNPIVVGIHNRGTKRPSDYIPRKPVLDYISESDRNASGMWSLVGNNFYGDDYIAFIATTLKPEIDRLFRTLADSSNTFIMGSSMGGLASIYALCEYPDIFGGAACMSTHWIGNFDYDNTIFPSAMLAYLEDHLPDTLNHRLYLDRGTVDLDSSYDKWEEMVRALVRKKGYTEEVGNLSVFTDKGASHSEVYWASRVDRPLHFLLASTSDPYIPAETEMKDMYVIFQDATRSWSKVNVFTWSPGVLQLGSWPGTAMTETVYNGKQAWEIRFSHKIPPTNIIFNDGTVQTADLDFKNSFVYNFQGPSVPVDPEAGIIYLSEDNIRVCLEGNLLIIDSLEARSLNVSTLDGRILCFNINAGKNAISLPSGVYIADGKKIIVRM